MWRKFVRQLMKIRFNNEDNEGFHEVTWSELMRRLWAELRHRASCRERERGGWGYGGGGKPSGGIKGGAVKTRLWFFSRGWTPVCRTWRTWEDTAPSSGENVFCSVVCWSSVAFTPRPESISHFFFLPLQFDKSEKKYLELQVHCRQSATLKSLFLSNSSTESNVRPMSSVPMGRNAVVQFNGKTHNKVTLRLRSWLAVIQSIGVQQLDHPHVLHSDPDCHCTASPYLRYIWSFFSSCSFTFSCC